MATFGKEEDYWDRLERLEAEAEGKSEKSSSAPSSSVLSRKRNAAAATSHGEKSRKMHPNMMHPRVRSVQQPMLPARPRPNKTQPARLPAGPLASPLPQKGSSRRVLRGSTPARGTEGGKQSREGKKSNETRAAHDEGNSIFWLNFSLGLARLLEGTEKLPDKACLIVGTQLAFLQDFSLYSGGCTSLKTTP